MSLPNTTLWGDLLPGSLAGDLAADAIDTTEVIDALLPSLHADSRADLTFWSEADLIEWMDEAAKRLARVAAVFVGRTASILTVATQAAYTLPVEHISTLHVSYSAAPLRPSNVNELAALDDGFRTTGGTPAAWYEDLMGGAQIALAAVPDTSDVPLPVIYEGYPPALDGGRQQTLLSAPAPIKGYLAMCVLAEAYGREGEAEAPEIAEHCQARIAFYDVMLAAYYGKGN